MKSSSVIFVALSLLGVLDASKSGKGGAKRIRRTTASSSTEIAEPLPVHRLITLSQAFATVQALANEESDVSAQNDNVTVQAVTNEESNSPAHNANTTEVQQMEEDDGMSLKSIIDDDEELERLTPASRARITTVRMAKRKNKRKRNDQPLPESFGDDDAAEILMGISSSNITVADINGSKPKAAKKKAAVEEKELKAVTENMIVNDTIKNFGLYFDHRNISTVGNEILFRCVSTSVAPRLGHALIEMGARLPDNEETAFIVLVAKNDPEDLVAKFLQALLVADPVGIVKVFKRAAEMTEEDDKTVDEFLTALFQNETASHFITNEFDGLLTLIIELSKTDRLSGTLQALVGARDRIVRLFVRALRLRDAEFIETVLARGWLRAEELLFIRPNGRAQTLISTLFGWIESKVIISLIKKYGYNLSITHESQTNPDGDILISALRCRDLESFKHLLLMGASLKVRLLQKDKLVTLEEYVADNRPEFYNAIQLFKEGKLQAAMEAEETEEVDEPDAMLESPQNTAQITAVTSASATVDLTMSEDEN